MVHLIFAMHSQTIPQTNKTHINIKYDQINLTGYLNSKDPSLILHFCITEPNDRL